jgi:hypothetical protein
MYHQPLEELAMSMHPNGLMARAANSQQIDTEISIFQKQAQTIQAEIQRL